jgi:putative nucleotidyltransferase with HDIG domain
MRERPRSEIAILGGIAVAILIPLAPGLRFGDVRSLATFGAFIFLAGLFDVELVGGRTVSLALAPALGYALLRSDPIPGLSEIAFLLLAASLATAGARAVIRRSIDVADMLSTLLLVVGAGAVYRLVHEAAATAALFDTPAMSATSGLAAVLAAVLAFEAGVEAIRGAGRIGVRAWAGGLRATAPLQVAITSVGALLALSYPLGTLALPLFVAPLAATQFAFRQFASIRKTYVQTISALARVPEMAGYTNPGHSRLVAKLSMEIARELGLPEGEIAEIEYAALLHDIGRVALPDPEDRNEDSTYRLELAVVGAGIVEETGYFPRVAQMIRDQNEPYRRRGEDVNRELAMGTKIIKVASAYDDLTRPAGVGRTPWDAIEKLHIGMAYDYDPAVIQALTRVLEKRNVL